MSETLKEAAKAVADAFNIPGPSPEDHEEAKYRLYKEWPTLYRAVYKLAGMLDDGWEYNIEELEVATGDRRVDGFWYDDIGTLEEPLKRRRAHEEELAGWGGVGVRKTFKVVKRRKPEGYVDA